MNKWVFRLVGLLVVAVGVLLFLDNYLNPELPDYIEHSIDSGNQIDDAHVSSSSTPEASESAQLSLTSLEDVSDDAALSTATSDGDNHVADDATPPDLHLTALDNADITTPVLSNPDSPQANVWLQAGSFSERNNADKRAAVLKAQRWAVEINPVEIDQKTYYRVYIGPLTYNQVKGYMDKLKSMGISAREIHR